LPPAAGDAAPPSAVAVAVKPPTTAAVPNGGPITDTPRFRDTEVLALAADALVPSGKTFRECVETASEKWPFPVHLYYEGNGRWLIETHVQEVQVVFHEATETFTTRNFAPPNPDCL
jgi:hypothetical protein